MPRSEDSRQPGDINQTLRLPSSVDDGCDTDQTIDSQLYATIKNGTADIAHLRVLIPGFEILQELGRGAFGVVYRARDVKLDRHVAIKVSLLDDPSRREQYIREARNAAKLEAIGIVPVFQVGTLRDGQPFVVQRLIDGDSLRKLLADGGALDLGRTCQLMVDIAEAMAHAHAVGMIHRDLKPDNILIDAAGRPWVADFGLAILEEDQKQHRGERAGTPLYMSPEQLRGRTEWLDGRTDIYALGIMLYEMLTGRPPFDAQNLAELEEQVLHRDPRPITQRVAHLPAAVDVIFQNCCAKQVNDRYANAHELVADLQSLMAELAQSDFPLPPAGRGLGGVDSSHRPSPPLPVSVRRKTLLQSGPGRTTQVQTTSSPSLHRYGLPVGLFTILAVAVAVAVVVAVVAFFKFWPPTTDPQVAELVAREASVAGTPSPIDASLAESSLAGSSLDTTSRLESPSAAPPLPPPAVPGLTEAAQAVARIPQRPFRVSRGSDGTHNTIQAAIAMAEEGETITILPGNYMETLRLTHSLNLVGQGNREEIVIVGENESAVFMEGDIAVTLNNLTLEGIKSGDTDLNTIDVQGGALTLQACDVHSRSFDCVKLQPGSGLNAHHCRFRTMAHPAISADNARQLILRDCNFDIRPPTLDTASIPVGVQAVNCAGTLRNCSFVGAGAAIGVHWQATQQPVSVEDCNFENCEFGLVVQGCDQFTLAAASRAQLTGCQNGVLLDRSSAAISRIDIHGTSGKQGIRIVDTQEVTGSPRVTIEDCRISGYRESLSIERTSVLVKNFQSSDSDQAGVKVGAQGRVALHNSIISDCEMNGILVEDATAELTNCQLLDNAYAGIFVDSHSESLTTQDCFFRDNTSGLLVASGTVSLKGGAFEANMVGILISSRELLNQKTSGEPVPIFLDLDGVSFEGNQSGGMVVRAPCSYRLVEGEERWVGGQMPPRIIGQLKAAQVDGVTVVKQLASGGKKL